MSSTVVFATNTHGGATKKRKRMPGTNHTMKPEIKQVNWFRASDNTEVNRIGYDAVTFYPSCTATYTSDSLFWKFYELPFVYSSPGLAGRIGARVQYLYARFKGYLHVTPRCNQDIRWRMVLYRLDDIVFEANQNTNFAKLYANIQSVTETSASTAYTNWQHNFYKKVWNVNAESWCKHKVIASGVVPRAFDASKMKIWAVGSSSSYQMGLFWDNNQEPYGVVNIPVDVKVKLYDNVDNTIRYYLCFEADCPIGWAVAESDGGINPHVSSSQSPFSISIFSRLYYQDY